MLAWNFLDHNKTKQNKKSSKSYFIESIAYNYIGLKVLSSFSHGLDEFLFRIRAKFGWPFKFILKLKFNLNILFINIIYSYFLFKGLFKLGQAYGYDK